MSRWFRHYAGMMRDEKLVRVALRSKQPIERVLWVWGAILESAAEVNDGGRFDMDLEEVAYFLRADESDMSAVLTELTEAGRVTDGVVANWSSRQFQSDGNSTRGSEGYVYVIGSGWADPLKIGYSRNPWARVVELRSDPVANRSNSVVFGSDPATPAEAAPKRAKVLCTFRTGGNSAAEALQLLEPYSVAGGWINLTEELANSIKLLGSKRGATYDDLLELLRSELRSYSYGPPETESESDLKRRGARTARPPRATMISKDWKPSADDIESAKAAGLTSADIARAAEKFVDHFRGEGARKTDWSARWRNWCRGDAEKLGRSKPSTDTPAAAPLEKPWRHHEDSPQFEAWNAHAMETGGVRFRADSTGHWRFATEWPPGHPRGKRTARHSAPMVPTTEPARLTATEHVQ